MAARKPEQKSWDTFSGTIDPRKLKVLRIENLYSGDGMGDVLGQVRTSGVAFWLENKAIERFPARDSTYPMRNVFEPGQLAFLRGWKFWKGHAFVLLRVGLEYFLLDPDDNLEAMTETDIYGHAIAIGKKPIIEHLENLKHGED